MHCHGQGCSQPQHRLALELLEGEDLVQAGRDWFLAIE